MEILAMPPVWTQSGSELLTTLDTLEAIDALVKTCKLQVVGRLDEMGTAQELGARDTVELLAERYRRNPTDIRKDLAFTAALPKYPAVTAALPDPADPTRPAALGPEHAKVIVTTLEKAPSTVPVDVLEVAEEQMVQAARITNPRELADFGRKVLARLDTDGAEPAEEQAEAKESLRLRRTEGGVKFTGFLAGASGEQFVTQMHTLSKPHQTIDGERDPRSLEQRQADALKVTMDAAAGNRDYPGVPHLTVTIDFNDLKNALADAPEAFRATGTTHGSGGVGELVFGGNLSAGAVRLLACDAAVLPIVLSGDSQPLDVGTEQRFVNRYLRRALNKRDKGCVVCKAPPWMCHAHHVQHWADGGPTSLQNLALLCAHHHRAVHNGQWTITITGGIVHVRRPDWADPQSQTDPAALAAVVAWATPARTADVASSEARSSSPDASGASANSSASASNASANASTSSASAGVGRDCASSGDSDCTGSIGASATTSTGSASASVSSVVSSPVQWPPDPLPAASRLPDPGLAAAREAFRARLISLVPGYTDPWATNATPAAGP